MIERENLIKIDLVRFFRRDELLIKLMGTHRNVMIEKK